MFKKNEIKKALQTICNHEKNFAEIAKKKSDAEQTDKAFVRDYANKLYSDNLYEYLNDNRFEKFEMFHIEPSLLGCFGHAVANLFDCDYDEFFGDNLSKRFVPENNDKTDRICLVGIKDLENVDSYKFNSEGERTIDGRFNSRELTFITESGNVLTTLEINYYEDGERFSIRVPDNSITPTINLIEVDTAYIEISQEQEDEQQD